MDKTNPLPSVQTAVKSRQQKSSVNNEPVADGNGCDSQQWNVDHFENGLKINIEIDAIGVLLFFGAILTRFYRFGHPNNIV